MELGDNLGGNSLCGWLRKVKYFHFPLVNANLQILAAGGSLPDAAPFLEFDFTGGVLEAQTGPLKNPRLFYQTHTRDLLTANVVASTEAADGPKDAPLRPETYDYWKPTAAPGATWRLDMGSAKEFDYVMLVVDATVLQVEWCNDDAAWAWIAGGITVVDGVTIVHFPKVRARYVRVTFGTITRMYVFQVGLTLAMPYSLYGSQTPVTMNRETEMSASLSDSGQFLGQSIVSRGVSVDVGPFKHLEPAWVRTYLDPFIKAARLYPYGYAWRPSDYPEEVAYIWTTGKIAPSNMGKRQWMQAGWKGVGTGYD